MTQAMTDIDISDEQIRSFMYWQGIPTLLGCPIETDPRQVDIALVGLPLTSNPVERTQYLAPRAVRHRSTAYHRTHREFGVNPFDLARIRDMGDVPFENHSNADAAMPEIEQFYRHLDAAGARPFTIGGDHSITLPVLRSIAGPNSRRHEPVSVIHFDSHTDSYPSPLGGVTHHPGAGFRMGVEEGLIDPTASVQIGINGPLAHPAQDAFSQESGYRIFPLTELEDNGIAAAVTETRELIGDRPVFISVDLDVLTLADAPAVADPEAGGLTANELFRMVRGFRGMNVVGGDIACFVPHLDPSMVTAINASAIMHHIVTLMAEAVRS
ncbi:arginase family protein [Nocardia arthritidis]|uniref:Arginase n=1 Tax=Nocardia arthritidis TaxID=228602 RepID=A0A6G9YC53_9NOCA|nr:arginase family protein [Nocardia arthritidis]QIS10593.1 arginase [Nocardia arthritidis]